MGSLESRVESRHQGISSIPAIHYNEMRSFSLEVKMRTLKLERFLFDFLQTDGRRFLLVVLNVNLSCRNFYCRWLWYSFDYLTNSYLNSLNLMWCEFVVFFALLKMMMDCSLGVVDFSLFSWIFIYFSYVLYVYSWGYLCDGTSMYMYL